MFGLIQSLLIVMRYFMYLIGLGSLLLIFYNLPEDKQPSTEDIVTVSESHQ
jgi:hypothetical protein